MESKIKKIQTINRRDKAMWYMYLKCDFSLEEVAGMFKISKQRVWEILNRINDEVVAEHLTFEELEE